MVRARGDSGLDGFLNLCKPSGPTSHDLVAFVRRAFGTRRVGHAGTLDPLAEGVLPIALGRATRLIDVLADSDKEYYAEIVIGRSTSTDDAEGELLEQRPVVGLTVQELDQAFGAFVGETEQRPPAYSAVKVGGRRAYDLARRGQDLDLAVRRVTMYSIERRLWQPPVLGIRLRCSKGTYVRSLARDFGAKLGLGGSLQRLVRLRVGCFELAEAVTRAEIEARGVAVVQAPDVVLTREPAVVVDDTELEHLRHGRTWPDARATEGLARAYTLDGELIGLAAARDGCWQPKLTFVD